MLNETGGDPNCEDLKGLSGEITCMQFMPKTYAGYSKETVGRHIPPTKTNAMYVSALKIEKWIREGKSDRDIMLMWNAGTNAKKCSKGVNKYKVKYNSCAYVEKGIALLSKL